jgi:outer membrane lipoprotein SlyB
MRKTNEGQVREAVGVFSEAEQLISAIDELERAGFERSQFGILAAETTVEASLGELYHRTNAIHDPQKEPAIAFISRDSIGEIGESMRGGLYFVGMSGAAGAIVASAAIFGGAMSAVAGGVIGLGLVGLMVGAMIHQSDANELQQRVDEGHILLFVRLPLGAREKLATDILARYSSTDVKVYDAPIKSGERIAAD